MEARQSAIPRTEVHYPDSDGERMADNTLQFEWISVLKWNLDSARPDFVAGDLLWYPVRGNNKIRVAPDVFVAVGRPKGYRGSYKQWEEGNQPPTVVFEIWSPSNSLAEVYEKHRFYEAHGVMEFYLYDPDRRDLSGSIRSDPTHPLLRIANLDGWKSPALGITLHFVDGVLSVDHADGTPFRTWPELVAAEAEQRRVAEAAVERAEAERERAEAERERAEAEHQRAESERARAESLAARLRALGIDPETMG